MLCNDRVLGEAWSRMERRNLAARCRRIVRMIRRRGCILSRMIRWRICEMDDEGVGMGVLDGEVQAGQLLKKMIGRK